MTKRKTIDLLREVDLLQEHITPALCRAPSERSAGPSGRACGSGHSAHRATRSLPGPPAQTPLLCRPRSMEVLWSFHGGHRFTKLS